MKKKALYNGDPVKSQNLRYFARLQFIRISHAYEAYNGERWDQTDM
jgi:hypothetical protein